MQAAIHKDDSVITAYRCHAWTYIRGIPVADILSELAGKDTPFKTVLFKVSVQIRTVTVIGPNSCHWNTGMFLNFP